MKGYLIGALIVVNLLLVFVLVFGSSPQPAQAQAFRGQTNYIMASGRITDSADILYVVDLATRRMVAIESDVNNKGRLSVWAGAADLKRDLHYPE